MMNDDVYYRAYLREEAYSQQRNVANKTLILNEYAYFCND